MLYSVALIGFLCHRYERSLMIPITFDECALSISVKGDQEHLLPYIITKHIALCYQITCGFQMKEAINSCFCVMNVHTFLAFRKNIFVNSVSIHLETCLLLSVHLQGPPPMPSLSEAFAEMSSHMFLPSFFFFFKLSQHLLLVFLCQASNAFDLG